MLRNIPEVRGSQLLHIICGGRIKYE